MSLTRCSRRCGTTGSTTRTCSAVPAGACKTTSARILARCLNCEQGPTPTPCGECRSCRDLARNGPGSIDVIEIDAASHGGVDDARDLREKAFFGPAGSRYKIYIIDEAHMVTSAGFNALLKVVEEPPEHLKFIFATTEPRRSSAPSGRGPTTTRSGSSRPARCGSTRGPGVRAGGHPRGGRGAPARGAGRCRVRP